MAVNLSPYGGVGAQFLDNAGNVLTGGKIFTYAAGTTTNQPTYTTSAGNIPHSNPIILDASGRVPSGGEIWLTDGLSYKFILRDANDVLIATYDNVTGINSNFVAFTNQQEIQTATAGQTVFNFTTMTYQPATNSLTVFVDGVNQYGPGAQYAYVETDSDTVTFVNGLHVGAEVKFTTSQLNSNASQSDAFQVSYTPPFTGSVGTNVGDKLAQTISVMDFGAVGDGVTDDTAAILAALTYLKPTGGTLFFPNGVYLTDSIDLRTYKSITLTGTEGGAQPWLNTCQIKIRTACAVGIQMADENTDNSTNSGTAITIQNFYLNCNNLATTGMNMNYNIFISNVAVRFALGDGIIFEGFTFPIYLNNVNVQYCGGNGLKVKGPLTTVYSVYNSGFSNNDGYGVYIEAGAFFVFNNVTSQSNKQGGLKIYYNDPAIYTATNFLAGANFYNFYAEASGSLNPVDPNYEGNYSILVDSYDTNPTTSTGKISRLLFQGCQFNKTPTVGQLAKLQGFEVNYVFTANNINENNLDPAFNRVPTNISQGWNVNTTNFGGTFNNVAIGYNAYNSNSSGSRSVAIGTNALGANVDGTFNTAVGGDAGNFGANANTDGDNNTFIGYRAVGASPTADNTITLGNSSITTLRCQVTTITALSDARDKDNINPLTAGLDFVNKLKPVSFDWNMRDGAKVGVADTGFIAQDLKQVQIDAGIEIPGLVYEENPEKLEAAYGKLIPVLVKAIQELKVEVDALKAK